MTINRSLGGKTRAGRLKALSRLAQAKANWNMLGGEFARMEHFEKRAKKFAKAALRGID